MKVKAVLAGALFAAAIAVSAQEFDITGAYSGDFAGSMVRLLVRLESPDEYAFHILEKFDDTFTMILSPADDGQFFIEEEGFQIHFAFNPRACETTAENETLVFEKKYGGSDSITGIYTHWMEEGESVLIVVDTEQGYRLITEVWEVEDTLFAPAQSGNSFRVVSEGDDALVFEFTPDSCKLTTIDDSISIRFAKEGADDPGFLGIAGRFGAREAGLPDFSMKGNTAETFQRIYGRALPRSSDASSSSLYVLDSRRIELPGEEVYGLSPDGSHILTFSQSAISFYNAETMTRVHRSAWDGGPIDLSGVSWSPRGTRIVFSEAFFLFMREPDLYVIDIEEGTLRKLTEDGTEKVQFSGEHQRITPLLDVTPAWTPDGKGFFFQRIIRRDEWNSRFFFLPLENEEARPVSQTLSSIPSIVNIRLSHRSSRIFYTNIPPHVDEPEGGIWVLGSDDPVPRQILRNTEFDYVFVALHEVAFTDDKALIYFPQMVLDTSIATAHAPIMLLNLENGETTDFSPGPSFRLLNATFSPDGKKILYTYHQKQGPRFFLAVRDVESNSETVLLEADEELGISLKNRGYGLIGLDWAANDTIFVLAKLGKSALLIRLGVR